MHVIQHKRVWHVQHDGVWVPWTTTWRVEGEAFEDDRGETFSDHNLLVEVSKVLDADIFSNVEPLSGWDKYGHVWSCVGYHIFGPEKFEGRKIRGSLGERLNDSCSHFRRICREGDLDNVSFPFSNYGGVWDPDDDVGILNALRRSWIQIYRDLTR